MIDIRAQRAVYTPQVLHQYQGNPLIEALPDIIDDVRVTQAKLTRYPELTKEERSLGPSYRLHLIKNLRDFYVPLSIHYNVEQTISRIIRNGYINRNPELQNYVLKNSYDKYAPEPIEHSTSDVMGLFGMSGVGKTSLLKSILGMYPKIILHTNYKGDTTVRYQITSLIVQVPSKGSTKALMVNLLSAIDELLHQDKYKSTSRINGDNLPDVAKRELNLHSVGIIVLDELQNLHGLTGKSREQLINFIVSLSNTFNVPIIMVGTLLALPLFEEFRSCRRISGEELFIWNRIEKDEEWEGFVSDLFRFQWTANPIELSRSMSDLLYEESQGITDIAVNLFALSQYRAITTGIEQITSAIVKSVAHDNLILLKPMLEALKNGDEEKMKKYSDLCFKQSEWKKRAEKEESHGITVRGLDEKEQTNSEIENQSKIYAIASWLVQAGYQKEKCESIAYEVIEKYGANTDEASLNQYAIRLMLNAKGKKEDTKRARRNNALKDGELIRIYNDSRKKKEPIYEALKRSGYIADKYEFFE